MSQVPDEIRPVLHAMWSTVAPQWASHADFIDDRATRITSSLLDGLSLQAGDRLLELACGPGGAGLAAAPLVLPGGSVTLSDVSADMVGVAAARAEAAGHTHVDTAVVDFEAIDLPDGSFDAVLCRDGLMFAAQPARAVREIGRVLCPSGRFTAAVWGPRSANPWLGFMLDAVTETLGVPVPPPGVPGPFDLGDVALLRDLFTQAGFGRVEIQQIDAPMRAGSFDEWRTLTVELAGPVSSIVAGLDHERQTALVEHLRVAAAPFVQPDGSVELPGLSYVVVAHRA